MHRLSVLLYTPGSSRFVPHHLVVLSTQLPEFSVLKLVAVFLRMQVSDYTCCVRKNNLVL